MSEQFRRETAWSPAYDHGVRGGVHGMDLRFHLIGEHGATQLVIFTNWHLPEVTNRLDAQSNGGRFAHLSCHPMPADLGYHRLTPAYEGQDICQESCELLGGKPCYYDGSGLMAQDLYDRFVREGEAVVWQELERFYRASVLDEGDDVSAAASAPSGR